MGDCTVDVHKHACKTIQRKGIECGPGICPAGTECCQEEKDGVKGNVITCCALGSCDKGKGLCSRCVKNGCPSKVVREGYNDDGDDPCSNWKWAMALMIFIVIILGIGFISIGLRCKALMAGKYA